jgi:hypothetical protein
MRRLALLLLVSIPLTLVGYASAASGAVSAQHLSITIGNDGTGPVTATGTIADTGTYTTLSGRQAGKGRASHGTFRIDLSAGSFSGKYTAVRRSASLDKTTCVEIDKGIGVDIINKHLGIGKYAGMKGTGLFTYISTATGAPTNGGCDMSHATTSTQVESQGFIKLAS